MSEFANVYVEMYLAPEATGVYDWQPVTESASNTVVLREHDVVVSRGNEDLNEEPRPGWCTFTAHDPDGNLNEDNPMGIYYGSIGRGTPTRGGVLRSTSITCCSSAPGRMPTAVFQKRNGLRRSARK